jgi:hypothetical protein
MTDVVSHRFKLEQIADVYKRFNDKQGGIEKVFLEVGGLSFHREDSDQSQTKYARPRAAGPALQADVFSDN